MCFIVNAEKIDKTTRFCSQTVEKRYQCFINKFSNILSKTKEKKLNQLSIENSKKNIRTELKPSFKKLKDKELVALQKIVKIAREKNISNKGNKYKIYYGKILEPIK